MVRPKVFLDTNICISVANGTIGTEEWRRVQRHISSKYRYYISFITRKELFSKLARGSDEYFQQSKESLRVLFRPSKRRFLPYPSVFAIRTILGKIDVARESDSGLTEEEEAEASFKAVLDAPSKAALKSGIKARHRKRRVQFFDLDHFDQHEDGPQREHTELLKGIRAGTINKPDPIAWAAWILEPHGLQPYTDDCEKLVKGLDAAYRYGFSLTKMAKNESYDFKAHASDWGDTLQLFHLCDESMHFLTLDADFRNRTTGSPQRDRILLYPEFLRSLAGGA
jgi:predicted nucleic acid-binding protein